jgi:rRNA maturation endonuclease Nob1
MVLDTAALLEGANLTASQCRTTPEVVAEVRSGGASGRRLEQLLAAGLGLESPDRAALKEVDGAARAAGSSTRLSEADRSVLGLAVQHRKNGTLLSDDYTVLDLARRLNVNAKPVTKPGIEATKDWVLRCSGCGRVFAEGKVGGPCPVCGSEIRLKPKRP